MHQHTPRPLPAPLGALASTLRLDPEVSAEDAATLARYEALTPAERTRAARLIATTGCDLLWACAAVEATRAEVRRP